MQLDNYIIHGGPKKSDGFKMIPSALSSSYDVEILVS